MMIFDPTDEDLIQELTVAARAHFLDPSDNNRCVCGRWVEGDDWDEHIVRVVLRALTLYMLEHR